jgi:hypothetical protein
MATYFLLFFNAEINGMSLDETGPPSKLHTSSHSSYKQKEEICQAFMATGWESL